MRDESIPKPDEQARDGARYRQARLTKPPGSLGLLEDLVTRLAALQGVVCPQVEAPAITVFAADHGITAEDVSAFPQAVTGQILANFASGGAAINAIARHIGAHLEVIDVGTIGDQPTPSGVRCERAGDGTANFATAPAMTGLACERAQASGRAAAERAADAGADIYIAGEMGIGNTTAATAVATALLDARPEELVGGGSGLNAAGVHHKAEVISRALAFHGDALTGPEAIMERVGGYELAAMMGAYTRAAELGLPVLLDGFIATVSALAAVRQRPAVAPWLIAGHRAAEPGHALVHGALGDQPLLDLGMRLGEASGAGIAVPLIRTACHIHGEMATFASAGIATGDNTG